MLAAGGAVNQVGRARDRRLAGGAFPVQGQSDLPGSVVLHVRPSDQWPEVGLADLQDGRRAATTFLAVGRGTILAPSAVSWAQIDSTPIADHPRRFRLG